MIRLRRLIAACVAVAGVVAPAAYAALPSVHSLGAVRPTPSGVVNTKYRNGDDGTVQIPLLWGTCPSLATTTTASDSFNLRTLCNLLEPGSPDATLSLLSGSLPTGCAMATDGIDCTTPTAGSASVTVRATRNADTADAGVSITVTAAGTDSTPPTVPLGLVATDNADGTGTLSWDASSDPSVSGIATGVASYRVQKDGGTLSTITAPSANVQPVLAQVVVGASDNESSSQAGADWTLTFGGGGLVAAGDHVLGRLAAVTGDFVATAKIASYAPTSGTTGSIGIAARASTSANVIAAYARWKDSDDQCNLRYRWQAGSMANGADSVATYTLPVWIRLSRVGDVFAAACSADGNVWVTTSSHTISPGATLYVGPFITSGSAGDAATGTVAQFNVHQGSSVSAPITASGSYTVSSYDGTNRSAESAAVTLTPTGGPPPENITVPAATATVCNSGCTYTPSQLATIVSSAANATANGIAAGSSIELRADTAGGSTTWAARLLCNSVSGSSGNPIWFAVRAGDTITLSTSTGSNVGLLDLTNCDYWHFVGSRDGNHTGLQIADRALFNAEATYTSYPNQKTVMGRDIDGVVFWGLMISGSRQYDAGFIDKDSSDLLFRHVDIGYHGTVATDFNGDGTINTSPDYLGGEDSDSGEIFKVCATRVVYEDVAVHHTGHKSLHVCGPYHVFRRTEWNGDWVGATAYPMFTGNHSVTVLPMLQLSAWNTTTIFGPLIEDSLVYGVGSEPEHKLMNESMQFLGKNGIFRGNYIVQRSGPDGWWGRFGPNLGIGCAGSGSIVKTDYAAYNHWYHNTLWGGAVALGSGALPAGTYNATACAEWKIKNNLFQGQQYNLASGSNAVNQYRNTVQMTLPIVTASNNDGYANAWKGWEWTGNVFARHPTDPAGAAYWAVSLGARKLSASSGSGTGTGSAALTDCTAWPSNWCGNTDYTVTWTQSGTTTAIANYVADAMPDPDTMRAVLTPTAASVAAMGAAPALTTVDAVTDTTHISLASARYFKDAWGFTYDFGGLHTEYGDCIAIGASAATAVTARITAIDYSNGNITFTPARTISNGWSVWKATDNGDGTCGGVWDQKGAAQ